jgi:alpha-beta hydrolase superfamily lysophospholipase
MTSNITNQDSAFHEFLTSQNNPKGIIYISHGMAEHIGRYRWLIDKLNLDGYHVISIDHRGHGSWIKKGKTQGFFSDTNGWDKVSNDLSSLILDTHVKYPNINHYLIAHSMGSWIGLNSIMDPLPLKGLIITGSTKLPNLLIRVQRILILLLLKLFGSHSVSNFLDFITIGTYNNKIKPQKTASDWISSDPNNVQEYINDPLCGFKVTNGLWNDLSYGLLKVFNKASYKNSNHKLPIVLISGSLDPVSNNGKGVKDLYNFLLKLFDNINYHLIENERHEVFSGLKKDQAYKILRDFLIKNI